MDTLALPFQIQLELTRVWWLLGLAALPALVYFFYRSLVDFARWQRVLSLWLRGGRSDQHAGGAMNERQSRIYRPARARHRSTIRAAAKQLSVSRPCCPIVSHHRGRSQGAEAGTHPVLSGEELSNAKLGLLFLTTTPRPSCCNDFKSASKAAAATKSNDG